MRYSELAENTERTPAGVKKRLQRYLWSKFKEVGGGDIEIKASPLRNRYEANRYCFGVNGDYTILRDVFERLHALLVIEGCEVVLEKNGMIVKKSDIGNETASIEKPYNPPYSGWDSVIEIFI